MIMSLQQNIGKAVVGKEEAVEYALIALLCKGHVLIEDVPGVGKTTLASALARSLDCTFRRIQFTPDLMPSDLTGFSIYRREKGDFVFRPGSIFCNIFLADEINRASPKTQSALLEVMEERKATVEGETRAVPAPFLVIATQNPTGSIGTQLLPEAQVDRFMISTSLGYPDYENELDIIRTSGEVDKLSGLVPVINGEMLEEAQAEVNDVYVSDPVCHYILDLITATRTDNRVMVGGSPRATLALTKMSKASAWLQGRDFVLPEDVTVQFPYIITHRLVLTPEARIQHIEKDQVIRDILRKIRRPSAGERRR
jgi:MoxR-like ATPase